MNYTISLLTARPDCEALIDITNLDKERLAHRKKGLELNRDSTEKNAVDVEAELISAIAEAEGLTLALSTLPEGPVREEMEIKFKRADLKRSMLEKRKDSYGNLALLEKEYDIACLGRDIEEADEFLAAITQRMNELPV